MRRISDIAELRQIQMGILSFVDKVCRENKIKYSICYGTLIGAIRHGGYIPWDDDIDIILLRKDYDRFIELLSKLKNPVYELFSINKTPKYYHPYAKVSDSRTLLIEPDIEANIGVNIDIFPVDDAPDEELEQKKILARVKNYINLFVITGLKWRSKRPLIKNMFMMVIQFLLLPIPRLFFSRKIDKLARLAVKGESNTRGCLVWGYGKKELMPSNIFDSYTDVKFENITVMALAEYDKYLSHIYGDYMQLPPEEKRVTHHSFKAYWK